MPRHAESDDAESDAEPLLPVDASSWDLEADDASSPAPATMRGFTGTFDDPSLEAAFASAAFREAFAVHMGLMAVTALAFGAVFGAYIDTKALIGAVFLLLTVVIRVYLHQHKDPQTAQKLGAASWTILLVILLLGDLAVRTWEGHASCKEYAALPVTASLYSTSIAVINGTHGMRLWHKTGTAVLLIVDALICWWPCSESPGGAITINASFLLGYALSHAFEYARRRSYLLHEQQRLLHEQQKTNHAISCERSGFDIALLSADITRLRRDNEWLWNQMRGPGTNATGGPEEPESSAPTSAPASAATSASSSAPAAPTPASGAGPSGLHPPSLALSSVSSGSSFDRTPDPRPRNQAEAARLAAKRKICTDRQLARRRRREWSRVRLLWIGLRDPGSMLHALRAPELVELISKHILHDLTPFTTLPAPTAQPEPPSPPPRQGPPFVPLFLRILPGLP